MKNVPLCLGISLFLVTLWVPSVTPAIAASAYSVSPFVIDLDLEPRDIHAAELVIKNTGTVPLTLFPAVNNVSVGPEGGIENFVSPSMSDRTTSLAAWLEVSRQAFTLQPGETKNLPIRLQVHQAAVPGTYHAFIGFAPGRTRDDATALIMQGGTPGTVVNVTIEEKSNEFLKLSRFVIDRFITRSSEDNIAYTVHNSGDAVLVPQGDIILYSPRGEEVGTVAVNPERTMVPPGETAVFRAPVPTEGLLGKYKALLSVEYGTAQTASVQDTVYFYVLPWKKILIMFGIVLVGALLLSFFIHRRYFGTLDEDDADRVPLEVRTEASSEARHHDLDMKR